MAQGDLNARFINYPIPTPLEQAYQTPPPAKNPVVKGAALNVLSTLVAAIPVVSYVLWSNAGFGDLRDCKEINSVEGRADPTVIPIRQPGDELPQSHTNISTLARAPPHDHGQPRFYTIQDFHDAYKAGAATPTEVVEALLPMIRRDIKERGPHSTAFTESRLDLVRAAAEASTQRWQAGTPLGILDGVPFAVKDDLNVTGYKTHYGTKHDYTEGSPVETSWCVKKVEDQGAVMVGKLNMHELGADTTNNNPVWGTPLNPYNNSYYTGGSSGGLASAVGHGIVPFGIGSDGGGSIRIPGNYCGLYGLKPSHGRVSTAPMEAGEKSVVVRGPLASSMADLELSFRVLGQPDPSSFPSSHFSPPRQHAGDRPKVIGIFKQWFDIADPSVRNACQSAVDYMRSTLGYKVVDITIPLIGEGQTAHAMTILSEGVDIKRSVYSLTPANRILMSVAKQTPTIDFLLAQRVRNAIMEHLSHLFQTYPGLIIVTPTTPNAGWPIEKADLAYGMTNANMTIRNMEYVWLANFTGVPCIQFPVGYVPAAKGKGEIIPVGLSGHGEWGSDDQLIEFGYDGERFLREGIEGGKRMPEGWVDVLKVK